MIESVQWKPFIFRVLGRVVALIVCHFFLGRPLGKQPLPKERTLARKKQWVIAGDSIRAAARDYPRRQFCDGIDRPGARRSNHQYLGSLMALNLSVKAPYFKNTGLSLMVCEIKDSLL
jgi:hypothetical protein